jgi:hypothetical protein
MFVFGDLTKDQFYHSLLELLVILSFDFIQVTCYLAV